MWFIGLAGCYDNDGGIIPLKGSCKYPSDMWSARDKDRDGVGESRMDFLAALSVLFTVHKHGGERFSFPVQTDARRNDLTTG